MWPANVAGMKRPRPSNDNASNPPPMPRYAWDVYRAAARARWVRRVIASTADAAIEAAAVEVKTDAWKLIAVRRYESRVGSVSRNLPSREEVPL
jgi:hypothetical protein